MSLYKPAPFDLIRDYSPITGLARPPLVMVVNTNLPVSNVLEFIAWAKASGKANYGSAGNGTNSHMAAALFGKMPDFSAYWWRRAKPPAWWTCRCVTPCRTRY